MSSRGRSDLRCRSGSAPTAIGAAFGREETNQETIAVLANGNLDLSIGRNTKKALPDRDRFLVRIEPNFEYLLRTF
jgi:hypothetical protein